MCAVFLEACVIWSVPLIVRPFQYTKRTDCILVWDMMQISMKYTTIKFANRLRLEVSTTSFVRDSYCTNEITFNLKNDLIKEHAVIETEHGWSDHTRWAENIDGAYPQEHAAQRRWGRKPPPFRYHSWYRWYRHSVHGTSLWFFLTPCGYDPEIHIAVYNIEGDLVQILKGNWRIAELAFEGSIGL